MPLDEQRLQELALRYVGRYATTRAKLSTYLSRKVRERGWAAESGADIEGLVSRFAELGYVDDQAFAISKAQALSGRGYGKRRLVEKLRAAGIEQADRSSAEEHADAEAFQSAMRFAKRRRLGPFAIDEPSDPKQRERALAAMVRAGHDFALARRIMSMRPGDDGDV